MLQQRKKDYLMRLLEELSKKLMMLLDKNRKVDDEETLSILKECYDFFHDTFGVTKSDDTDKLIEKIDDRDLLEQYAKLLLTESELTSAGKDRLSTALDITEYLQNTDVTFSWDRTILREDILRKLDKNNE